jgi:hypothetical protein
MILFSLMQPTYFNLLIAVCTRSSNFVLPMAVLLATEVPLCQGSAALDPYGREPFFYPGLSWQPALRHSQIAILMWRISLFKK